ncbi:Na+/H+ antiporter NhaC-like protein (plasmid) [Haloterrigena turkmenica DSM 5511]|uniref:Na+/H+ antiporter NhaC-like protein n=1 Tax=Haloterrigena turkmenica (strain ATCC 51198 / DSM 5511 / JCM 9101 / NCIMB 13204 / VKM B-1734 / 4k) TaxID=543526 RepID=D2S0K5_HALTV|nr:Na+/H+ antiporter NhaC family protein [Haloterrigena turkmenica]ADB62902.1 Na+/H+ antiporter NhaC-like protein [Haloterrigena turkmenica DSM 5511]
MAAGTFGIWSVLPLLVAIVLALLTRKAALALFIGVWAGGAIYHYQDSTALLTTYLEDLGIPAAEALSQILGIFVAGIWGLVQSTTWVVESVGNSVFNMQIVVFCFLLGSAVAMIWRLGGTHAVTTWATNHVDTKRKAGLAAWAIGLLMFFDDYANSAIVGTTMKDISDNLRMSREKLAYIVDSTAAPVSTLTLSSWAAFQLSMIDAGYQATDLSASETPSSFVIFLQSIPFNMYAILAIAMVAIIVVSQRDYGEMLTAEHRAAATGEVTGEDAQPMQDVKEELGEPNLKNPRLRIFFVPVLVLVAVMVAGVLWSGYSPGAGYYEIIINADYASSLVVSAVAMVATTFYYAYRLGLQSVSESVDTTIEGFEIMMHAVAILVFAWSIGEVVSALGTGDYVAGYANAFLTPEILIVIVMIVSAFMAFTGDSWAAMGALTPIAVPIAWNLTGNHTMVAVAVGAVFSGAIFGDHTSPISPSTVLSATFTGADLIDHVRTQIYYAVPVMMVSVLLMLIWGYGNPIWGRSIWVAVALLPLGVLMLVGVVYGLSQIDADRKDIDLATIRDVDQSSTSETPLHLDQDHPLSDGKQVDNTPDTD